VENVYSWKINCGGRGDNRKKIHSVISDRVKYNLPKINFSIPNAGTFAAQGFPVGGATGVLYARRSADGF